MMKLMVAFCSFANVPHDQYMLILLIVLYNKVHVSFKKKITFVFKLNIFIKVYQQTVTFLQPHNCRILSIVVTYLCFRDDYIVFAGGMPRASYSDRHTITVQHGKRHVVFDFTSKVIDFFTVAIDPDDRGGYFQLVQLLMLILLFFAPKKVA